MKTLILGLILVGLSSLAATQAPSQPTASQPTASQIATQISLRNLWHNFPEENKPVLNAYTLLVMARPDWNGYDRAWNQLVESRKQDLTMIAVYYTKSAIPKKDVSFYNFADPNGSMYYFFEKRTFSDAVLIGPKGDVLFRGDLDMNGIQKVQELIKARR